MTLEHVLAKSYNCYKASKFLGKSVLAKSLFWHETTLRVIFSKIWISEVNLVPSLISLRDFFPKKVNSFQPLTIFANKLYQRCSTIRIVFFHLINFSEQNHLLKCYSVALFT